jgi:hypothetical protein
MAWAIDRNQKLDAKMRELIDESATADIKLGDASDVSALLERMSGLSLAEMDSSIRELQKAQNFLLNERERLRLEIAEHFRLTKAALGLREGGFGKHREFCGQRTRPECW